MLHVTLFMGLKGDVFEKVEPLQSKSKEGTDFPLISKRQTAA